MNKIVLVVCENDFFKEKFQEDTAHVMGVFFVYKMAKEITHADLFLLKNVKEFTYAGKYPFVKVILFFFGLAEGGAKGKPAIDYICDQIDNKVDLARTKIFQSIEAMCAAAKDHIQDRWAATQIKFRLHMPPKEIPSGIKNLRQIPSVVRINSYFYSCPHTGVSTMAIDAIIRRDHYDNPILMWEIRNDFERVISLFAAYEHSFQYMDLQFHQSLNHPYTPCQQNNLIFPSALALSAN